MWDYVLSVEGTAKESEPVDVTVKIVKKQKHTIVPKRQKILFYSKGSFPSSPPTPVLWMDWIQELIPLVIPSNEQNWVEYSCWWKGADANAATTSPVLQKT